MDNFGIVDKLFVYKNHDKLITILKILAYNQNQIIFF